MATQKDVTPAPTFAAVLELIATLRGENGCPWDRKQTPKSMAVYLIEEVFELVEAIEADDTAEIMEEMGDALFQIFFSDWFSINRRGAFHSPRCWAAIWPK